MTGPISQAIITDGGYAALANALATGGTVSPKTARVSATVHELDRAMTSINGVWWEGSISVASVVNEDTYEARVHVQPDQADDYMRTVGLYLDDGTLFCISQAKDLPPHTAQELIIQLTYTDLVSITNFEYLSWECWEQALEVLDLQLGLGGEILKNAKAIGLIRNALHGDDGGIPARIGERQITVGVRNVIKENMTITCTPGGTGADFCGESSLDEALAWLGDYAFLPGVSINVKLADGVYGASTKLSTIKISHPQSEQIITTGNTGNAVEFPISAAQNAPSSANKYIYVDNQSGLYSALDFMPGGDYAPFVVYVVGSSGNDGPYSVVAATDEGSDIRLTVDQAVNDETKDGTLYLPPCNRCQLHFAAGENGFHVFSRPAVISGLYLLGDITSGAPNGLYGDTSHYYSWNTILRKWHMGAYLAAGSLSTWSSGTFIVTECIHGIMSIGSDVFAPNAVAGNCVQKGFSATGSGAGMRIQGAAAGACGVGFHAADGASIDVHNGYAHNNITGCRSERNGEIYQDGLINSGNNADRDPAGDPPVEGPTGGWII